MERVVRPKQDTIFDAFGSLINGGFFIVLALYFFNRNSLFALVVICGALRFSIYQTADLWVSKTIFSDGNLLYIKCWGIKFKLNPQRSFLIIENMLVLNPVNAKFSTLNIYRNPSSFVGRLFKNKIKLYTVTKDNIEESRKEAQKIFELFGVPFKDVYEFE